MATVRRFEELNIWQAAREQCKQVEILVVGTALGKDYSFRDQIGRSSGSVMDNIAEGFDRFTKADFRHYLVMARGSNAEVRSQLYRSFDKAYISQDTSNTLIKTNIHLSAQITNLINHLGSSNYKTKLTPKPDQLEEPEEQYVSGYDFPNDLI